MIRSLHHLSLGIICSLFFITGCFETYIPPILDEIPILKDKYGDHFLIGSMIQDADIVEASDTIEKHCSIVTVNRFYWMGIHPEESVYNFEPADRHVAYAQQNGMMVRGHPLLFGTVDPEWIFMDGDNEISREKLIQRMKDHIQTIVSRYKGKIDYWDVVNEPTADIYFNLNDDPSSFFDYYKKHKWYTIIGEEYIQLALTFAHEADPAARLYVNENNIAGFLGSIKQKNFYEIIKGLVEKGAPIHGVGIQGHWSKGYPSEEKILEAIDLFSNLGLDVQITELDISTYPIVRWAFPDLIPVHDAYTPQLEQKQTERYYHLFDALRKRSHKLSAVVFWGLSDPSSWLRTQPDVRDDWPLLFDENYQPKNAFWAVVDF